MLVYFVPAPGHCLIWWLIVNNQIFGSVVAQLEWVFFVTKEGDCSNITEDQELLDIAEEELQSGRRCVSSDAKGNKWDIEWGIPERGDDLGIGDAHDGEEFGENKQSKETAS